MRARHALLVLLPLAGAAAEAPRPLFGDVAPLEQGASLRASGAEGRVVAWLAGRGVASFVAAGDTPIEGYAHVANRALLFEELARRGAGLSIARTGSGTGPKASFDEPGIPGRRLVEQLADLAGHEGVVIASGVTLPELAISVREVPADAVLEAIGRATGTRIVAGRDLLFVLPAQQALAALPAKKPAPALSLRAANAPAPAVLALLEAAGVPLDSRVPCTAAGAPLWLDADDVRPDEAHRAVLLASGAGGSGAPEAACLPRPWDGTDLRGATPLALVRTKKQALALVQQGGNLWLVAESALPKGTQLRAGQEPLLGAAPGVAKKKATSAPIDLAAWAALPEVAGVRLLSGVTADALAAATISATVVDPRSRSAALRDPALGTLVIPAEGTLGDSAIAIGHGELSLGGRALALNAPPPPPMPASEPVPKREPAADPLRNKRPDLMGDTLAKEHRSEEQAALSTAGAVPPPQSGGKTFPASEPDSALAGVAADGDTDGSGGERDDAGKMGKKDAGRRGYSIDRNRLFTQVDPSQQWLWVVQPFQEKTGWLGANETALASRFRGASWGDTFALALEAALRERGRKAHAVGKPLDEAQIKKLVQQEKLRYVVGGQILALAASGGTATLTVRVRVDKQVGAKLRTEQVRDIPGSAPVKGATLTDGELHELMKVAASKAADAVADSIPQDMLASRN